MNTTPIALVPLDGLHDPHLLPWLELYERAFPPDQRYLIATMLELALAQSQHGPRDEWLLAALDCGEFAGLVHYRMFPEQQLAALWGLATRAEVRGRGLGAGIYTALWQRLAAENCRALIFEVERPDVVETDTARALATRRIGFYRRMGAQLLTGIEYLQRIGPHQPPVPMYIMVHAVDGCSPEDAFSWAKALFGDAVLQVGEPGLE